MDEACLDPLAVGQRIIEILETGKKTSTYKLATLHALIDCCIERVPDNSADAVAIPLNDLTLRVMELYWPQTYPFDGIRPLRQSGQPTTILDHIDELRTASKAGKSTRLDQAEKRAPDKYRETFEKVKATLVRYPLVLLQRVPGSTDTFLYDDTWLKTKPTAADIARSDNVIQLRPGVADAMARLAGLLKPTLEYLWVDKVWKSNQEFFQESLEVKRFLFDQDRIPLSQIRSALIKAFGANCFYCGDSVASSVHVDHVLPLSKVVINGLANLVLSCSACNSNKSGHLPALEHVERALGISLPTDHLNRDITTLDEIAHSAHWDAQYDRVLRAARGLYKTTPPSTPTWAKKGSAFEPLQSPLPDWIWGA
jgi:hypothetical protein